MDLWTFILKGKMYSKMLIFLSDKVMGKKTNKYVKADASFQL